MKQLPDTLRKSLIAFVAMGIVAGVTALSCELGFRTLLFSQVAFMQRFQEPSLYTDPHSEDDWWKLYYAFAKPANDTAKYPHSLLGWANNKFSEETYLHTEAEQVGRQQQPLLLYGDSFTNCLTPEEECFQGILNIDPKFSQTHYLLNYGVAGYGVDQIYLLLKNSLPLYLNPYVAVGIYTRDLDRSIFSFFVGQKPYFEMVAGELVLQGTPIVQSPKAYLSNSPPQIWSYLYRLWLYQEGRPWRLRHYLRGIDIQGERKKHINENILLQIFDQINARQLPHLFVIFADMNEIKEMGWREAFLREVFSRYGVPYFSTRDLIREDIKRSDRLIGDYYITKICQDAPLGRAGRNGSL